METKGHIYIRQKWDLAFNATRPAFTATHVALKKETVKGMASSRGTTRIKELY